MVLGTKPIARAIISLRSVESWTDPTKFEGKVTSLDRVNLICWRGFKVKVLVPTRFAEVSYTLMVAVIVAVAFRLTMANPV